MVRTHSALTIPQETHVRTAYTGQRTPFSRGPDNGDICYMTGELKLASPKLTSAQAHQITTFETFFT